MSKVGSIVYATHQGLGVLAKQFYDNGMLDKVIIKQHPHRETVRRWYSEDTKILTGYHKETVEAFVKSVDVMVFFETPFWWDIITLCNKHNVKTIMIPMYEWSLVKPPYTCDLYLCPSLIDLAYVPNKANSKVMRIPVDPTTWQQRRKAVKYLHNAGNGSVQGRPGTKELLEALQYVNSPIDITFRTQNRTYYNSLDYAKFKDRYLRNKNIKITWEIGNKEYKNLFDGYDVFVAPERFNGLSLPLQEARAAGMYIITTNRFPTNFWLTECTYQQHCTEFIDPKEYVKTRVAPEYHEFNAAVLDPLNIAKSLDRVYETNITTYSNLGLQWAEQNSWEALTPEWYKAIRGNI